MNEIDMLTKQTLIKCAVCGEAVPLAESVWAMSLNGHPEYKCRPCHGQITEKMYEQRALARRRDCQRISEPTELRDIVAQTMREKINVPHISELAEEVVTQLGGLESFVRFWVAQGMATAALKPGSRHVLDFCRDISKLIEKSTQHRETAPDVSELDDQAILGELRKVAHELIQSKLLEADGAPIVKPKKSKPKVRTLDVTTDDDEGDDGDD